MIATEEKQIIGDTMKASWGIILSIRVPHKSQTTKFTSMKLCRHASKFNESSFYPRKDESLKGVRGVGKQSNYNASLVTFTIEFMQIATKFGRTDLSSSSSLAVSLTSDLRLAALDIPVGKSE